MLFIYDEIYEINFNNNNLWASMITNDTLIAIGFILYLFLVFLVVNAIYMIGLCLCGRNRIWTHSIKDYG